jgi:hypothetical protein
MKTAKHFQCYLHSTILINVSHKSINTFFSLSQHDCRHLHWLLQLPVEAESSVMTSVPSQTHSPCKGHQPQTIFMSPVPFTKVKGKILVTAPDM